MNKPIDFDAVRRRQALDDWLLDCKRRMALRFPRVDFDSDRWPIKTLYQTKQADWYFTESMADFANKDSSYSEALRCLTAEVVIAGEPKDISRVIRGYRLLSATGPHRLFDLSLSDLRTVEEFNLSKARSHPPSADGISAWLGGLSKQLTLMAQKGVIPRLGFQRRADIRAELRTMSLAHRQTARRTNGDLLDRRMEAFNEVINYMVDGDPRLSSIDHVAISTAILLLCAPSRINEVLCLSTDDHVTVEDYAQMTIGAQSVVHSSHQMLIITMKGSKGAEWGPKPVLKFMIDAFHYAMSAIVERGKRSRMLVEWYLKHPDTLYLPPDLEYLRGRNLTRWDIAKIVYLNQDPPKGGHQSALRRYVDEVNDRQFDGPNPNPPKAGGRNIRNTRPTIKFLAWKDVEALLLARVRRAMVDCRRVTQLTHYEGDLSKMLFLFDDDEVPFLPGAVNYARIKCCLKQTAYERQWSRPPTVFAKLGVTMPINGKVQIADMETHDPRRWLTTMALIHGEQLSDVLINKWANRCKLSQLAYYDFRTAESKAAAASMPDSGELNELTDLSNGLAEVERLEEQFGLQTTIVNAHDAGIAVTSMDAVMQATENRPIARSSRGIIVIYPQPFGICLHQHHEKPCRNYSNDLSASCITCMEGVQQKGHLPTNEATRSTDAALFQIILRHLETLARTHNRNVADDPAALGEHMLTLVEKGLSRQLLEGLANHLIDEFHQITHLLRDRRLSNLLEQAFVARGAVKILDNDAIPNGALFKYHNPKRHAEPLLEIALDEHGGREQVQRDEQALVGKYPQFAAKALGLEDQRHLISPDGDEAED